MKFSISWHQKSFDNVTANLKRLEEEIELKRQNIVRLKEGLTFYDLQIKAAIAKGKDGFDADKFLMARKGPRSTCK